MIDEIPQNTLEILTWVLKMITWKSNSNKLATLDTCPSKFKGVMKSHKKNYHCSLPIAKKNIHSTKIQGKNGHKRNHVIKKQLNSVQNPCDSPLYQLLHRDSCNG